MTAPVIDEFPSYDTAILTFNPDDLITDADRLQFKTGGDQYGVTDQLKSVTRWQPAFAGTVVVWRALDGKMYIGDGHQRLGAARRLKTDAGGRPITLNGFLLDERDGWTVTHARIFCAVRNLAEGGESTKPVDIARALRNGAGENLFHGNISFFRKSWHLGQSLAKLGEEPFRAVLDGHYPEIWGAMVAERLHDAKQQMAALRQLASLKHKPATHIALKDAVDEIARSGFVTLATQAALFDGMEDYELSLMQARMDILETARNALSDEKTIQRSLRISHRYNSYGSPLQPDGLKRGAAELRRMRSILDKLVGRESDVSQALSNAAHTYILGNQAQGKKGLTHAAAVFLGDLQTITNAILPATAVEEEEPAPANDLLFDDTVQDNLFTYRPE